MGTHCLICKQKPGKDFVGIYCHWDGYFEGVGEMLSKFYTDEKKVDDLMDLGYISSLREKVSPDCGEEHNFEHPADNVTIAYHRDRGDAWTREEFTYVHTFPGLVLYLERLKQACNYEYLYAFIDGKWAKTKIYH